MVRVTTIAAVTLAAAGVIAVQPAAAAENPAGCTTRFLVQDSGTDLRPRGGAARCGREAAGTEARVQVFCGSSDPHIPTIVYGPWVV